MADETKVGALIVEDRSGVVSAIIIAFVVGVFGLVSVWPTTITNDTLWVEMSAAIKNIDNTAEKLKTAEEAFKKAETDLKDATSEDSASTLDQSRLQDLRKAELEARDERDDARKSAEAAAGHAEGIRVRMASPETSRTIGVFGGSGSFLNRSADLRMMAIVAFAALIGSAIHAARGLSLHIANGTYDHAWAMWYWFRPGVGVGLALIVFFALRGMVTPGAQFANVAQTAFGFAMIGALTGMFSGQASKRLEKTFEALFGDQEKPDAKPAPAIASVSKVKKDATGAGLTVTVKLTALDPAKLKVFVDSTESTSAVGPDKKSLVFDLAEAKAKSAGKVPFTLRDDAGKEYKSEVEIVA